MKPKKKYLLTILAVGIIAILITNEISSSYDREAGKLCDKIREAKARNIRNLESEKKLIESVRDYNIVSDDYRIKLNQLGYAEEVKEKVNKDLIGLSSRIERECLLKENSYDYMLSRLNNCISAISSDIEEKSRMITPDSQNYKYAVDDVDAGIHSPDYMLYTAMKDYENFITSKGKDRAKPECRI